MTKKWMKSFDKAENRLFRIIQNNNNNIRIHQLITELRKKKFRPWWWCEFAGYTLFFLLNFKTNQSIEQSIVSWAFWWINSLKKKIIINTRICHQRTHTQNFFFITFKKLQKAKKPPKFFFLFTSFQKNDKEESIKNLYRILCLIYTHTH